MDDPAPQRPAPAAQTPVAPDPASRRGAQPRRVWPALAIVAAMWVLMMIPINTWFYGMQVGALGGAAAWLVWWLGFSRAPLSARFLGFGLFIAAVVAGMAGLFHRGLTHPMAIGLFLVPGLLTVVTLLLWATRTWPWRSSGRLAALGMALCIGAWACLRTEGLSGYLQAEWRPRWAPTAEERFLEARGGDAARPLPATPEEGTELEAAPGDWPGFRGAHRTGIVDDPTFPAEWDAQPREVWRRDVGPGWGSFCLVGPLAVTQEQRGASEVVVAYDAETGDEAWENRVEARFEETVAGAGPRATPTFHGGALYTTGASGVVQRLDASTGKTIWRRELTRDTARELAPEWGFAASPLVVEREGATPLCIVFAGNPKPGAPVDVLDQAVIAYDAETGEPVWRAGVGFHGYSSVHLATLRGVEQALVASNLGLESLDPATGKRLWFYEWSMGEFPRVVQPLVVGDDRIILATGYGGGTHCVGVEREGDAWSTQTLWQTGQLKPYFNDLVLHDGHLYGFDGPYLTSLSVDSGEPTWPRSAKRRSKYGHGQALLIEPAGLLVVTTEETGEVVLVEANPEDLKVRTRFKALTGKTWNHPAYARHRLYVRNGEEAACFDLTPAQVARRAAATR